MQDYLQEHKRSYIGGGNVCTTDLELAPEVYITHVYCKNIKVGQVRLGSVRVWRPSADRRPPCCVQNYDLWDEFPAVREWMWRMQVGAVITEWHVAGCLV